MLYVHDLPPWLVCTATVGTFVVGSLAGLALTRGISRRRGLHALVDNGVIGWIFSAVLGIYAIAIGLMAVATWGNISAAEAIASREAAEIAALYRDLGGYPMPLREKLQGTLVRYTRYVIDEAWPRQRRGEPTERARWITTTTQETSAASPRWARATRSCGRSSRSTTPPCSPTVRSPSARRR